MPRSISARSSFLFLSSSICPGIAVDCMHQKVNTCCFIFGLGSPGVELKIVETSCSTVRVRRVLVSDIARRRASPLQSYKYFSDLGSESITGLLLLSQYLLELHSPVALSKLAKQPFTFEWCSDRLAQPDYVLAISTAVTPAYETTNIPGDGDLRHYHSASIVNGQTTFCSRLNGARQRDRPSHASIHRPR